MKVVIAPDSFKGTLSADAVARAMAEGVRRVWPDADIVLTPLADGGEGTADALISATSGRRVLLTVTGPLGEPVGASYGLLGPDESRAVVEMASASGLHHAPEDRRDPRTATTYGVGELVRAALSDGVSEIIVGLGGSATNDGGAGAMQALGARFLDAEGRSLAPGGAALIDLARIDLDDFVFPLGQVSVIAASDVRNPLIGPNGASAVYGPQKGANAAAVEELDAALTHYADIVRRDLGGDVADLAGAGAAGGLGAALAAFLKADFRSGIDVVMEAAEFERRAAGADLVITGEGRIDSQTLSGKLISGLLERCRALNLPLVAVGGSVDDSAVTALQAQGLRHAAALVGENVTLEQAKSDPARYLADTVALTLEMLSELADS